jgi:hypothetical protein
LKKEQEQFGEELEEVIDYCNKIAIVNNIVIANNTNQQSSESFDFNELTEYNFEGGERGEPIYELSIQLGTDNISRYSCACHKNNIAVRMAINNCTPFVKILSKLSRFASNYKKSINLVKISIKNKARLRIENKTRWSSTFLMLESFHKAYLRNVFSNELSCPVSLEELFEEQIFSSFVNIGL